MMSYAVWIDQQMVKLYGFTGDREESRRIYSRPDDRCALFPRIAKFIASAERILLLGPGVARHQFQNYLREQHPSLARKVVRCETTDDPSDPQIAAMARKWLSGTGGRL